MREIIFKGRKVMGGEWVEGSLDIREDSRYYILRNNYAEEVQPATVGQFTGLVDTSGRKVWEGDIIRFNSSPDKEWVVTYSDTKAAFILTTLAENFSIGIEVGGENGNEIKDGIIWGNTSDKESDIQQSGSVCLIAADGSCILYNDTLPLDGLDVRYVGVNVGNRSVFVGLHDLRDGASFKFVRNQSECPEDLPAYTRGRINAFENFDGKKDTEAIRTLNTDIPLEDLQEGEYIPSMGELGLLMMSLTLVNKALTAAGGEPLECMHWSSTQDSRYYAWGLDFSNGDTVVCYKSNPYPVRPAKKV